MCPNLSKWMHAFSNAYFYFASHVIHQDFITITSYYAPLRLESPANRQLIQTNSKENVEAPPYWSFVRGKLQTSTHKISRTYRPTIILNAVPIYWPPYTKKVLFHGTKQHRDKFFRKWRSHKQEKEKWWVSKRNITKARIPPRSAK